MADVFYAGQKDYIFRLNKMASDLQAAFTQVQADWNATSGPTVIQNKPTFAQVAYTGAYADLTGKPVLAAVATSGLKADVGLGNVDNTSDANKPVSSATQTALNLKTTASVLAASGGGALVGNNPAGNIAATTVQAALNELDAEKAKLNGDITQPFSASTVTATNETITNSTITNLTVSNINGGPISGMRNRLTNGNFRVNQFGATSSSIDGAILSDMWGLANSVGASFVTGFSTMQAAYPLSITGGGNLNLQCTTAKTTLSASDYCGFTQNIEGFNVSDLFFGTAFAKQITISFRAVASLANTVIAVSIRNAANTRSYVSTVTVGTTAQGFSVTIPGDTTGTWAKDTTAGMVIAFYPLTGSTFIASASNSWLAGNFVSTAACSNILSATARSFSIADVQLEAGAIATPAEIRPFAQEVSLCQRYYYEIAGVSGQAISTTALFATVTLPYMRSSPSAVLLTPGTVTNTNGTPQTVTGISILVGGQQTLSLQVLTSGLTAGQGAVLYNSRIAFIARP